ncbi:hypothetical protein ANRL3_00250 [Anaerolineae bacterium]|nr:hypothetical protein ANRL3_00250 [Anaerolineae bacterium]
MLIAEWMRSQSAIINQKSEMNNIAFPSNELKIAAQLYLPDAARFAPPYPGVVICHGIGSRKESHASFAEFMAQNGFAALAFDFRGHGESDGQLDDHTLDDVIAAIDFLAAQPGVNAARLAVRGSSMGGMFALHAAIRDARLRAVAAIAPANEERVAAGVESGTLLQILARENLPVRVDVPAFARYLRSRNARAEIAQITPRALLLIHCKGDELVPYRGTEELLAAAREPKKLLMLDGGHHRFAQQDIDTHRVTLEWFREHL